MTTTRERPEDVPERFAQAWNRGDADALANLFVADADFVNVVGLWWRDRDAIRRAHDYGLRVIGFQRRRPPASAVGLAALRIRQTTFRPRQPSGHAPQGMWCQSGPRCAIMAEPAQ